MNSRSGVSRPIRSNSAACLAVLAAFLLVCFAGLKLLPWPQAISSGWLFGAMMFAGGVVAIRIFDHGFLPDLSRLRSILCYAFGALVVQMALHLVAAFGF